MVLKLDGLWCHLTFQVSVEDDTVLRKWSNFAHMIGYNTTVSIQTHAGTIPALPELGKALSTVPFNISIPQLSTPGTPPDDKEGPHFIQDATVRVRTSMHMNFIFPESFANSEIL